MAFFRRETSEPVGRCHLGERDGLRMASSTVEVEWVAVDHGLFRRGTFSKQIFENIVAKLGSVRLRE